MHLEYNNLRNGRDRICITKHFVRILNNLFYITLCIPTRKENKILRLNAARQSVCRSNNLRKSVVTTMKSKVD